MRYRAPSCVCLGKVSVVFIKFLPAKVAQCRLYYPMLYLAWSSPGTTPQTKPSPPITPRRKRLKEPTPCAGLTHKPVVAHSTSHGGGAHQSYLDLERSAALSRAAVAAAPDTVSGGWA